MLNIFGSPIRKAIKKTLNNRIKNAEIAFRAESKTLNDQKIHNRACLIEAFHKDLENLNKNHKEREEEIISKRVGDILGRTS